MSFMVIRSLSFCQSSSETLVWETEINKREERQYDLSGQSPPRLELLGDCWAECLAGPSIVCSELSQDSALYKTLDNIKHMYLHYTL